MSQMSWLFDQHSSQYLLLWSDKERNSWPSRGWINDVVFLAELQKHTDAWSNRVSTFAISNKITGSMFTSSPKPFLWAPDGVQRCSGQKLQTFPITHTQWDSIWCVNEGHATVTPSGAALMALYSAVKKKQLYYSKGFSISASGRGGGQLWAFLKAVEWNQCDQYVRFPCLSSDGLESLLHTTALSFLADKCKSMCV